MSRLSLSSLRVRLVLLVLIAVVPAFGLIVWTSFDQKEKERAHAEESAVRLTQFVGAQQTSIVRGAHQLFVGLADAPQIASGDPAACGTYLAGVNAVEAQYVAISLATPDGDILCSSITLDGPVNIRDREYFQRAMATREFAVGEYVIARGGLNVPTLPFAFPLTGPSGDVTGMLVSGLDLSWLDAFAAQLSLPADTTLTVLDRNGVVLAGEPDPEVWVGKTVSDTPIGREVLLKREGSAELPGLDGTRRLFAFAPLAGTATDDAYVAVGISTATAYAGIDHALVRNLVLLGVVAALALVAAWFGGGIAVLTPVRSLLRATDRLSLGDLAARSGLSHNRGELGQLARAFDEMATALEMREGQHVRDEQAVAQRTRELAAQSEALARSNAALAAQAEDLARSNGDLEQFAYVASHDLQEPLRMVANYTQLLGKRYKGKLDTDADEFIDFAVDGATRMQRLIEDLLAFSRVGTRRKELTPVACQETLDRALANLAASTQETGAVITHDELPLVMGDDGQLCQLFQNLIANGIRFRGKEAPRIHVAAARTNDEWTISVSDNGIGIDPQYADRIFIIFQRLHTREQYPGTGIGLAICKRIVDRHGGRIWVESDGAHGATFRFTLRAADVPAREREERIDELVASR